MSDSSVVVVIPARFESSRFPGKPLAPILGEPMLAWVWRRCCEAVGAAHVVVATDDDRIASVAGSYGMRVEMTSASHRTGTDRVAEVAARVPADLVVNVQGDEPLLDPESIRTVIRSFRPGVDAVLNGMALLTSPADQVNPSVPKVVAGLDGRLLYMSRAPIPMTKAGVPMDGRRQVCVYAFAPDALHRFSEHGAKTPLEAIEDIEILRCLELGIPVRMIDLPSGSLAVDHPADIAPVEAAMRASGLSGDPG